LGQILQQELIHKSSPHLALEFARGGISAAQIPYASRTVAFGINTWRTRNIDRHEARNASDKQNKSTKVTFVMPMMGGGMDFC